MWRYVHQKSFAGLERFCFVVVVTTRSYTLNWLLYLIKLFALNSLSQLRNFRIYLDHDWLRRLCFLHSGFYFAQAGGQCSLKSSFETFSYPSEECEALIRDFPFIGKYFFPLKMWRLWRFDFIHTSLFLKQWKKKIEKSCRKKESSK